MAHLAHYKEAHPLPMVITHYINLVGFILLIITGFMIHYPAIPLLNMGICRGVHIFCGIVIVVNCLVRIVMAFTMKSAPTGGTREQVTDYKSWVAGADNKHQMFAWIKFYLFAKKTHPLAAKFNPLQKIAYCLVPILILFMGLTGFALWAPTAGAFAWFTTLVGGLMNVRIIHYFMMFVFIIFMIVHVYMAFSEGGMPLLANMFLRKEHGGLTYDIHTHDISGMDNSVK